MKTLAQRLTREGSEDRTVRCRNLLGLCAALLECTEWRGILCWREGVCRAIVVDWGCGRNCDCKSRKRFGGICLQERAHKDGNA